MKLQNQKPIPAGKFKATCLSILDEVRDEGVEYVVTKYGKPVAKLVPLKSKGEASENDFLGTITIADDIIKPLDRTLYFSG